MDAFLILQLLLVTAIVVGGILKKGVVVGLSGCLLVISMAVKAFTRDDTAGGVVLLLTLVAVLVLMKYWPHKAKG